MTSKADDAHAAVEALGKRSPDALKLARAVSLASRVEPELLRKVRLELLPDLDAGAEADVWFSPLVQSTSPLAFNFLPAVADQLRRELAESRDSLTRAWQVLSDVHEHSPAAIKLEERVTWTILNGGPAAQDDVEKELMSVVSAILTQNRTGLARWALRAVPRFPIEARQTKAAQTLLITAAAHLGAWHMLQKQVENNNLPATFINDLKVVLPSNLQEVEVGVRLLDESDELGLTSNQRSYVVEFSNPPLSDQSDLIRVPGTVPLLVEVSWSENRQRQVKQLSLYRGRVETIKVDGAPVTIRTARGDVYTLSEEKNASESIDLRQLALERIPRPPSIGYVRRFSDTSKELVDLMFGRLVSGKAQGLQLSGPAGTGKTVVASVVARMLLNSSKQRVVWVSVEGRRDFDLGNLLDEVATQLERSELRTLGVRAKQREIRTLLGKESTIIFIDSFEVIREKLQISCLRFLKNSKCPYVVITRRRIARPYGPYVVWLSEMQAAEAEQFLKSTIRQRPNSQVLKELDLYETMRVCDRNPLAMQMFLAQIEFTGRATEAFKAFAGRSFNALEAIVSRSYDLPELGREGRATLDGLALFVPSASRAALSEVAGFGNEIGRLDEAAKRLTALKLICMVANGGRISVDSFIREYLYRRSRKLGWKRRNQEFKRRFVDHFLKYAKQHAEATSADYDALEAEFQNLLLAMDFALQSKEWNEAIRISITLNRFLDVRGYWDEALRRNKQAQTAARMARRLDFLPQLHEAAGEIYLRRAELAKAEAAFKDVLTHYRKAVNVDIANATRRLGSIAVERGNLSQGKRLYTRALEFSRQLKLDAGVADNLHNLAIVAQLEGKLDEAMKLYDESLRLSERVGDQRSIAISLHQLGVVSKEQGQYEQARNFFERSLSIKRSLGFRDGMGDTLHQLGLLFQTLGETQQATRALQQALTIYQELSSPSAAPAAADLAGLTTPERVAKPKRSGAKRPTAATKKRKALESAVKYMPSKKRKTTKSAKSPAKKLAAKKGAAKMGRSGISLDSLFRRSARLKGDGKMGGRFGPRSRKSFR